jgi:2-polyprenyl-3-methyl-5-hydroxy-6-metoxy-1,4-benzoquinol methylase
MNYKLLFPTYRNRYTFVKRNLAELSAKQIFANALNLGTGEGDYDPMIAPFCQKLTACDINEQDVLFAKSLNTNVLNLGYQVENALALSFPDNSFDLLTSVEVLEHVGQPALMIQEVGRVLKPGGMAIITFPSLDFPMTYDPINRIAAFLGKTRLIGQGAYAFGHDYVVSPKDFRAWAAANQLEIVKEQNMSGYLIGLLEMYWTGIIQRIFKANSKNLTEDKTSNISMRPSLTEPKATFITDAIIKLDYFLFSKRFHSVGKAFIVRKSSPTPPKEGH